VGRRGIVCFHSDSPDNWASELLRFAILNVWKESTDWDNELTYGRRKVGRFVCVAETSVFEILSWRNKPGSMANLRIV
jgi:hypothetical protein